MQLINTQQIAQTNAHMASNATSTSKIWQVACWLSYHANFKLQRVTYAQQLHFGKYQNSLGLYGYTPIAMYAGYYIARNTATHLTPYVAIKINSRGKGTKVTKAMQAYGMHTIQVCIRLQIARNARSRGITKCASWQLLLPKHLQPTQWFVNGVYW